MSAHDTDDTDFAATRLHGLDDPDCAAQQADEDHALQMLGNLIIGLLATAVCGGLLWAAIYILGGAPK